MPLIGNIYSGITYTGAPVNSIDQVNSLDAKLKTLVTERKEDEVVSVFMIPSTFFGDGSSVISRNFAVNRPTTLDGYTPRNKKLLSFPYMFLSVDTVNSSKEYYYERSNNQAQLSFILSSSMNPNPEIVVYPTNYNGQTGQNSVESVVCSGFPQCAFTIDSYRAWLSQKSVGETIGAVGSGVTAVAGGIGAAGAIAAGSAATAVAPVAAGILGAVGLASSVYGMVKEATEGSKVRGNQGGSTHVGTHNKGIYFRQMSINGKYARMIDSFLDRFGYTCGEIKIPNRNVRPYWTYTKTQECSLSGFVPSDDLDKIKSIYNKGITFWNNPTHVGNYSLDNTV